MSRSRGVVSSSPLSLQPIFFPFLQPLDAPASDPLSLTPLDPLDRLDRLDPIRRSGSAPQPLPRSASPVDGELARSMRSRMQDLHQAENAVARRLRPIDGGGTPTPPRTWTVGGHKYKRGEGDKLWLRLEAHGHSYRKWAKHHPKTARAIGRPKRIMKTVRSIRRSFKSVHSPLAKHASKFVVAGYLSGYNPKFIAAFAALESGWGRATPSNAPYNYWGWTVFTGNQNSAVTKPFKHSGTAFRYFGRQLRKRYGGAKSVFSSIWAPYAADPNHERNIASIMRQYFHSNPNDIRFPRRLRDA